MPLFGKNPEQELVDMLTSIRKFQKEVEEKEILGVKLTRMGEFHMEKAVDLWKEAQAAADRGDEAKRVQKLKEYINRILSHD